MARTSIIDSMGQVMAEVRRSGWTPALRDQFDKLDRRLVDSEGGVTVVTQLLARRHLARRHLAHRTTRQETATS